jgi:hypothetical protein
MVCVMGVLGSTGFTVATVRAVSQTGDKDLQETAWQVERASGAIAAHFGGLSIDEANHKVNVMLVNPSPAVEEALTRAVSDPSLLSFSQANYTVQDLTNLQQRIIADKPTLAKLGITITSVGIGSGFVEVGVKENDPSIAAKLDQIYGPGKIRVRTGITYQTAATRYDPPPLYGGMQIDNGQYQCTNGYIGARIINGIAYYQLVTAGHCFGMLSNVEHEIDGQAPYPEGQVNFNSYYSGSSADTLTANLAAAGTGLAEATDSIVTVAPYTHTVDYLEAYQLNQLPVCKAGITTEQTCNFTNTVTHLQLTLTDGVTLNDQVKACCDSVYFGDSGGPVYHYYQAQSINAEGTLVALEEQNGTPDGNMIYSFIQDIRSALGSSVHICTISPQVFNC